VPGRLSSTVKVTVGGGVELGGWERDRAHVREYQSLCLQAAVLEFGVYCAICAMYLVLASSFLNLMLVRGSVVVCSPSVENFDLFNYMVRRVQLLGLVRYSLGVTRSLIDRQLPLSILWSCLGNE
jgi:hypothetical protein